MTGMVTTQKPPRNSWWKQLWVWVLIAMALGIALGMAVPDLAGQMGPLGDAFIKDPYVDRTDYLLHRRDRDSPYGGHGPYRPRGD
jgi:hypothetical protein